MEALKVHSRSTQRNGLMDGRWGNGFKEEKAEFRPEEQERLGYGQEMRVEEGFQAGSIRFKYPG